MILFTGSQSAVNFLRSPPKYFISEDYSPSENHVIPSKSSGPPALSAPTP